MPPIRTSSSRRSRRSEPKSPDPPRTSSEPTGTPDPRHYRSRSPSRSTSRAQLPFRDHPESRDGPGPSLNRNSGSQSSGRSTGSRPRSRSPAANQSRHLQENSPPLNLQRSESGSNDQADRDVRQGRPATTSRDAAETWRSVTETELQRCTGSAGFASPAAPSQQPLREQQNPAGPQPRESVFEPPVPSNPSIRERLTQAAASPSRGPFHTTSPELTARHAFDRAVAQAFPGSSGEQTLASIRENSQQPGAGPSAASGPSTSNSPPLAHRSQPIAVPAGNRRSRTDPFPNGIESAIEPRQHSHRHHRRNATTEPAGSPRGIHGGRVGHVPPVSQTRIRHRHELELVLMEERRRGIPNHLLSGGSVLNRLPDGTLYRPFLGGPSFDGYHGANRPNTSDNSHTPPFPIDDDDEDDDEGDSDLESEEAAQDLLPPTDSHGLNHGQNGHGTSSTSQIPPMQNRLDRPSLAEASNAANSSANGLDSSNDPTLHRIQREGVTESPPTMELNLGHGPGPATQAYYQRTIGVQDPRMLRNGSTDDESMRLGESAVVDSDETISPSSEIRVGPSRAMRAERGGIPRQPANSMAEENRSSVRQVIGQALGRALRGVSVDDELEEEYEPPESMNVEHEQ